MDWPTLDLARVTSAVALVDHGRMAAVSGVVRDSSSSHLEDVIEQASDELRMIRAADYPEDAEDATPPPSVGAA